MIGSHIPLSVLVAAHHNLVAYGVAFADAWGAMKKLGTFF